MNDDLLDAHLYALSVLPHKENTEGEVYQHTFTRPGIAANEIDALIDRIKIDSNGYELFFSMSTKRMHQLKRMFAKGRHYTRWQTIRKRQRRAQHRKHCAGRTYRK